MDGELLLLNLIEGHDTPSQDIERALAGDFSSEPAKRALQMEAVAHIRVQELIDEGRDIDAWPASAAYAEWLHQQFCSGLPPEMLFIAGDKTGERLEIVPGAWRVRDVQVGRHVPPEHEKLPRFMVRFDAAYRSPPLSKLRQIQTVGAVHHRFLWIHPFLDGNGRVARLMSHALLKRLGLESSLWSVARGLALDEARYKALLAQADRPREGDRDGRGNLTQRGLVEFCKFFLERSVEQIRFMSSLLESAALLRRMEDHVEEEVRYGRLPRGSFAVLREAVMNGEVERSKISAITGLEAQSAGYLTSALVARGMLSAATPRSPLHLAFPVDVAERWFQNLYPAVVGSHGSPGIE